MIEKAARPSLPTLLKTQRPVLAPGAYDTLSARLVEAAGFLPST